MNLYRITQILWLVVSNIFYCSIIYGLSSFPLTNSYSSRWLLHHQPVMIFPKITPVMVHDQLRMSLISPIKLSTSLGDMFGPSRWIEHAGYLEKMRIRHDISTKNHRFLHDKQQAYPWYFPNFCVSWVFIP